MPKQPARKYEDKDLEFIIAKHIQYLGKIHRTCRGNYQILLRDIREINKKRYCLAIEGSNVVMKSIICKSPNEKRIIDNGLHLIVNKKIF